MGALEALGTNSIPIIAAFFIGLVMAFSPCPLATNITAIAYISRKIGDSSHTLLVGMVYSLGRMVAYIAIASLIVYSGLNIQAISFFLQDYGEKLLGPFLILMGIVMLGIIDLPLPGTRGKLQKIEKILAERGYIGAFLLGVIFALAFCPFSAVLFFGMLIPIALKTGDVIVVPAVFALATGLPVIVVSFLIVHAMDRIAKMMSAVQNVESWVKGGAAVVFIGAGVYYVFIVYGPLTGMI
ncbi:MAG TPA: aromatic aminobenezylarsenical efflux permease ArsG family transporter [Methanoregulaceae archaeon]|nr:aromatic aminobenezylarsenical efflux permease ArsG family transporter [Methanoregulaceae archaeon]